MKNKKLKLISIVLIGFLCILIGSPFINGETSTKTLAPNQYWGLGTTLNTGDTLNFRIESDPLGINIYIMTQGQMDFYIDDPQDKATSYIKKWEGYSLVTSSFIAESGQIYFILIMNPSDSMNTYIVIDASIDKYVPPIPKTITITSPTSYDTFENGINDITWTSTGDISDVKIELYKNRYFLETIISTTNNDGSYSWYIYDDEYTDNSDYQIKISDYDDNSIYDYSNYFIIECEIVEKTLTIDDPIDISNECGYIYWRYTGDIEYVKIDLYNDGYFLETIDSCTDNDGFYSLYIDDYTNSSFYQIKISDYDDNSIYDYSNYFTIEVESEESEPYDPYDPYDPNRNLWNIINNIIFMIVIPLCIVLAIAIPIAIFVKKCKRKSKI